MHGPVKAMLNDTSYGQMPALELSGMQTSTNQEENRGKTAREEREQKLNLAKLQNQDIEDERCKISKRRRRRNGPTRRN
jgi:hypothetical protein